MAKKRSLLFGLATALILMTAVGCGNPSEDPTSAPTSTPTTEPTSTPTEQPTEVEPETTKVNKVIISVEDEEGEGTIENPYNIKGNVGSELSVAYAVLPNDATDKSLSWREGSIIDGAFVASESPCLTIVAENSPASITIGETDKTLVTIEVKTNDGSEIVNYINVTIESYTDVSQINVSSLERETEGEYDYVFKTALGTNWDMTGDQLERGRALLAGEVMSGLQAPRNLTYWPTLYNLGIEVLPEDASDKQFTITSSDNSVVEVKTDGTYDVKKAGEAVVTVTSYANQDVKSTIKFEVADTLYDGILKETYNNKDASLLSSWDLDSDHGQPAQFQRYDDWNLVMMQANERRGSMGIDANQKIFYMGDPTRPYGINIENVATEDSGVDTTKAQGMMWAKLNVPAQAKTFNIKIGSTGSAVQGEYRVLFVEEDGTQHVLTGDVGKSWVGFSGPNQESTIKLELPTEIKGTTGAMVIEHRNPHIGKNAELSIKKLNFEGQVDPTGIVLSKSEGTYKPGDTFKIEARVTPDNVTNDAINYYVDEAYVGKGVTVANDGTVTIADSTPEGEYYIWAESVANNAFRKSFHLIVAADAVVNEWSNKNDILNGVGGVKWSVEGPGDGNMNMDTGVGEGADLHVGPKADGHYAALVLEDRKITADAAILTFKARTFRPTTEILPYFYVEVTDGDTTTRIRAIGASEDRLVINNEEGNGIAFAYDLSAFVGKTVKVAIGIDEGNHGVVTWIKFVKDQIAATSVALSKKEGEFLRDSSFTFNAFVNPREASNGFLNVAVEGEGKGVTASIVGSIVSVNVAADADLGDYKVVLTAAADSKISAEYALNVYVPAADTEVNEWNGKDEILNGKGGVAWTINGDADLGVGEGADIKVGAHEGWSSLSLNEREIKATSFLLKFGARVFHRDGETYPKFEVRITDENGTKTIRGIGQEQDYFYVDTDATQYCSYDLSEYIGKTVKVEIGVTTGTHAVVQHISFSGNANTATSWANKDAINAGGWVVTGKMDAGVGEGVDIQGEGSYLSQSFLIGSYNDAFTFGARVFHRNGETYPEIQVKVVEGDNETVITANGQANDYVFVDTDDVQEFTYDLSAFIGRTVEIRIQLKNAATHCAIARILMA